MTSGGASPGGLLPEYVLSFVTLALLVYWAYGQRFCNLLKYKRLPPGPFCLPFLGYLAVFDMNTAHLKLAELTKKYGSVFGIYIGKKYVVVLNEMEALKESFNREEFLDRPEGLYNLPGEQPFVGDVNGNMWKVQRRFLVSSLRQLGVGTDKHQNMFMDEVFQVCGSLLRSEGKDVNLNEELALALNNTVFRLVYGKRFEEHHPMIRLLNQYNDCVLYEFAHSTLTMFFPTLGKIARLTPQMRRTTKTSALWNDIIRKEIAEHKESTNRSETNLMDLLLSRLDETDMFPGYKKENILLGMANGVLIVGSATTSTSLVWFLLTMAQYPEVQRRVQEEIDAVLGRDGGPRISHRPQLPYTEATLWESMRFRNIIPFNMLRCTTKDTTLNGFDIPRGTLILHNMHSQFTNPEIFPRPHEFDPTRFLAADGRTVQVPEHFIPFSYGKRYCLGDKMATTTLLLFATTLLQRFDILPPEGGVSLEAKVVFHNLAVKPYARFRSRK